MNIRRLPPQLVTLAFGCVVIAPRISEAQNWRVMQLESQDWVDAALPFDRGIADLHRRLLELRTTASVMQTTAHPDDEQSGLLTYFARGVGARTSLLTLNRGEAGANAIGSELFDALGLVRTEELLLAGRYYGLSDQYFTSAADYGYSKTVREAARSWDTTVVIGDMVHAIRTNQPLVVISRWFGTERDGHGQHSMAGALTPLAVAAAADPSRYPEQIRNEGLRPWRVLRLFRSNLPASDGADVVIDPARYDPWLGESYQALGANGLSRQRSQTSGQRSNNDAPAPQRLQLMHGTRVASDSDLFSGLDTSLPGVFAVVGETEPKGARATLRRADDATRRAIASLDANAPWFIVPMLASALGDVRAATVLAQRSAPHAAQILALKERQLEGTIVAALGVNMSALAGALEGDGHPVVPGEKLSVRLTVKQASPLTVTIDSATVMAPSSWATIPVTPHVALTRGEPYRGSIDLTVPPDANPTRPSFFRNGISQNEYLWRAKTPDLDPRGRESLGVRVVLSVAGARVELRRSVRFRQAHEPLGVTFPQLVVVPPVSLRILPAVRVIADTGTVLVKVTIEVTGHSSDPVNARVGLSRGLNAAATDTRPIRVATGERKLAIIDVMIPSGTDTLTLEGVATVGAREWREELTVIDHPELEPSYLYAPAVARIRRVPVTLAASLKVGYIMGVGDLVPDAITQLGANVTLLDAASVSAGDFSRFDAVIVGTRAYAVRAELPAATNSLIEYAERGGNVVVLYQTQEFHPETMAPYPATLPDDAVETTEENSIVRILAPDHPLLTSPNRITVRDFDGWIEQRGSKFLTKLAPEYTSLVETHDEGEAEQPGIWVTAPVGAGRWSYVALALHRQLPYAVPGAYRILANLLSRPVAHERK